MSLSDILVVEVKKLSKNGSLGFVPRWYRALLLRDDDQTPRMQYRSKNPRSGTVASDGEVLPPPPAYLWTRRSTPRSMTVSHKGAGLTHRRPRGPAGAPFTFSRTALLPTPPKDATSSLSITWVRLISMAEMPGHHPLLTQTQWNFLCGLW